MGANRGGAADEGRGHEPPPGILASAMLLLSEHYKIGHIVQVSNGAICIGSPYIHDILKITLDGLVAKRDRNTSNADLTRYQREFDADPELLTRLAQAPDSFQASIPVFTYEGGQVLEKFCEQLGWPAFAFRS